MDYVLPERALGIVIMALFSLQGLFTLLTPGSLRLQRPEGGLVPWAYNITNLSTILLFTPLAALCLIKGWATPLAASRFTIGNEVVGQVVGSVGLAVYVVGNLVMYWSRIVLGRSFRLGAVRPGHNDRLISHGPFAVVRHPMYTSVICMALGLGLALGSWVFLALGGALVVTITAMIPVEEAQLSDAYGAVYTTYQNRTKRLVPLLY